jgi:hypothetical protein
MNELEVTAGRLGQIWWAMVWRGILALLVALIVFSIVCGLVLTLAKALVFHWSPDQMHQIGHFLGELFVAPVCIFASVIAIRMTLRNSYHGFRIALIRAD